MNIKTKISIVILSIKDNFINNLCKNIVKPPVLVMIGVEYITRFAALFFKPEKL